MGQVSKVISSNQLFDQVSLKREYKQDIFRPIRGTHTSCPRAGVVKTLCGSIRCHMPVRKFTCKPRLAVLYTQSR